MSIHRRLPFARPYRRAFLLLALPLSLGLALSLSMVLSLATQSLAASAEGEDYRLVVKTAACVDGPSVRLKDVAVPHGVMAQAQWDRLGALELFKSPGRGEPPMVVDKGRLREALSAVLGDVVYNCVLPGRLTIQRGGRLMDQTELYRRAVDALTPQARAMGGEAEFKEMTLPEFILLPDDFDRMEVETPAAIRPGRISFRFKVTALNGKVVRHVAASGFLSLWKAVPCAATAVSNPAAWQRMTSICPSQTMASRRGLLTITVRALSSA